MRDIGCATCSASETPSAAPSPRRPHRSRRIFRNVCPYLSERRSGPPSRKWRHLGVSARIRARAQVAAKVKQEALSQALAQNSQMSEGAGKSGPSGDDNRPGQHRGGYRDGPPAEQGGGQPEWRDDGARRYGAAKRNIHSGGSLLPIHERFGRFSLRSICADGVPRNSPASVRCLNLRPNF